MYRTFAEACGLDVPARQQPSHAPGVLRTGLFAAHLLVHRAQAYAGYAFGGALAGEYEGISAGVSLSLSLNLES